MIQFPSGGSLLLVFWVFVHGSALSGAYRSTPEHKDSCLVVLKAAYALHFETV